MTTAYPHLMPPLRRQWHDEGREEGRAEGRVEEAAANVLRVLKARGLRVSEAVERRIQECTDVAELESLLTRAATVSRAEDIFD